MKKILIIFIILLSSCGVSEKRRIVVDFATKPTDSLIVKYGNPVEDYSISFVDKEISTWNLAGEESQTRKVMIIYNSDKREIIKEMRFLNFDFDVLPAMELGWIDLSSEPMKLCNEKLDEFYKKTYYSGIDGIEQATYHHVPDVLQIKINYISENAFSYE
jgi:hypothetical protein